MGTSSPMIRFSNLTFESDYDNDEDVDDDEDAEDEEDEKEDEKKLGAKVTAANLLYQGQHPDLELYAFRQRVEGETDVLYNRPFFANISGLFS